MQQLWHDQETNKYYILDESTGKQLLCDKYGQRPTTFKPYSSGFSRNIPSKEQPYSSSYRVQPSNNYLDKFDGYFQCPRPRSLAVNSAKGASRLPNSIDKIPRPIQHLTFSSVYDKSIKRPAFRAQTAPHIVDTSFKPQLTTAKDIQGKLDVEKANMKGYQPPPPIEERRKLKGYFMMNYMTSGDLFMKEKRVMEVTNPVVISKQKHFETMDRKMLEKRREQKILKNRISGL